MSLIINLCYCSKCLFADEPVDHQRNRWVLNFTHFISLALILVLIFDFDLCHLAHQPATQCYEIDDIYTMEILGKKVYTTLI